MLRSACTFLCFLFLAVPSAAKQLDSDEVAHGVTGYLATMAANEHAKVCFAHVKLMMLGYQSSTKGLNAKDFVKMGIFTTGSDEYRLFEKGAEMSAHMDKPIDDYFFSCLDESLKKSIEK